MKRSIEELNKVNGSSQKVDSKEMENRRKKKKII